MTEENKDEITKSLLTEIKRLKESEAVFRYLFEKSMAPSILIEEDMTISMANQKAKELFGFGENKKEGYIKWPEFIHKDDIARMQKYHNLRRINEDLAPQEYECRLIDGNGRLQHIFIKLDMIKGTKTSLATFVNITSKKLAEKTLKEREEELSAIIDHVKGFIYTVFPNYKIEFANYALIKRTGKDIVGETCYRAIFKNESPCSFCPLKKVFKGESAKYEFKGLLDQRWYRSISSPICDTSGNVLKQLSIITDIHEIKLEEERLRLLKANLTKENIRLKASIKERFRFGRIIGKSAAMQDVYERILKAATSNANVIIYGESGTGKELAAKTIHELSSRAKHKFIPVNCGAIPENLMESQFFGYVKGAFTGAEKSTNGFLEESDRGTLFLDEIGEIPPALQVKLLRAIDEGGFSPLGTTEIIKPDLRIIGATNKNLKELVEENLIREDFFYRIHVIPVHLPPLRNRKEDIPFLCESFLNEISKTPPPLTPDVLDALQHHNWPGNIRELKNTMQRFVTLGSEALSFSEKFRSKIKADSSNKEIEYCGDLKSSLKHYEKIIIKSALDKNNGHRGKTADFLKITRRTLERKMLDLDLR
ncbi:MAG: sigma-54-dependent Fis family transcriptional regulator [Desulfobacteraceae bacterium]|nr:sigma-54-dependent Fis family transcriptional regulator [Desulfobacteraceae bacterium]